MKLTALLAKLTGRRTPQRLDQPVSFDPNTFGRPGPEGFTASWVDVRKITGYKIDLLTLDEIRMDFQLDTNLTVVVTEESPGFAEFMKEVERRFPSVAGWCATISQPAFATCTTVLYETPN